jgi:hypothetical protein
MDGTVLETHPYPIWEDTGPSYCFDLVQHLLRCQYHRDGGTLVPIGKRKRHPEIVRAVTSAAQLYANGRSKMNGECSPEMGSSWNTPQFSVR